MNARFRWSGLAIVWLAFFGLGQTTQAAENSAATAEQCPHRPTHSASLAMNADDYPLLSIAQNEQGNVLLDFQVNQDGSVADVKVARSSGFARLDGAAVDAARARWHFDPVLVDGKPVTCRAEVAVRWILNWSVQQFAKFGFTIVHMGASDYPSGSLARGERGASVILVAVSPAGKILDAHASQSSGFVDLDAAAIEAAKNGRWTVVPAQVSGSPVATTVGFVVIWSPSGK